jgi:hypothetical protein
MSGQRMDIFQSMNYTPTHGGSIMNQKNLKIEDKPENRYVSTMILQTT